MDDEGRGEEGEEGEWTLTTVECVSTVTTAGELKHWEGTGRCSILFTVLELE